ncbi:MAG TPA: hypothetical protein DDY41_07015 [Arthrobacter bacterium]|nr:hypothetical protein [Arthrobacter sp.]
MSIHRKTTMFICGGDFTPAARSTCPNHVHNWPLAAGYNEAGEQAARRLRTGWSNPRCPDCHLFGWTLGIQHETDTYTPPKGTL